jgi:hypothetical protein
MLPLRTEQKGSRIVRIGLCVSLFLTVVLASSYVPTVLAATCSGHGCDGLDPHSTGCDASARSLYTNYAAPTQVDMRTGFCSTKWVRTTNIGSQSYYAAASFFYSSYNCDLPCEPSYNISTSYPIGVLQYVYTAQYFSNVDLWGCGLVQSSPISLPTYSNCKRG